MGDPVRRGQVIGKIEDREIVEQVSQAEASQQVSKATIRQREADLNVAKVNFDRSKNLFERQLLAKQALDDAESRYLAAEAQIDLSKAQLAQAEARLQELQINLQNTTVTSPVDGFVGKRNVDPGAMVSQNTPIASVVDISKLRMVANVVEKDIRLVTVGDSGTVDVDAYPGEKFNGRIARVAPVLDPATRTASMEIEIANNDKRLKPGMYARVSLTVEERKNTLVAPKSAVVDFENKRGVWMPNKDNRAAFVQVQLGIEDTGADRDHRWPERRRPHRDDRRNRRAQQRSAHHRRRCRAWCSWSGRRELDVAVAAAQADPRERAARSRRPWAARGRSGV